MKKCADLDVSVGAPLFDDERLALYHKWHAQRETSRGWDEAHLSERLYRLQFTFFHLAAREVDYRDPATGKLVGVGLSDETARAWSAIYFFYDPDYADRSPGTANVVTQIEIARSRGVPYVYLGYCVSQCASLAYKAKFLPQERLAHYVEDDEEPTWVPFDPDITAGSSGRRG